MQSYNLEVLGWHFLRLLLRLQLRSLSRGVPSSHLEKDERLILGHICIYSWKRHALCYAVFGFARNRRLNTSYRIVWETKYGRFTTLNIPLRRVTRPICKRDQNKKRNDMDRRVTPPKRVTSPTWGPPPPRKQALNFIFVDCLLKVSSIMRC